LTFTLPLSPQNISDSGFQEDEAKAGCHAPLTRMSRPKPVAGRKPAAFGF
jgi:hypothetical protein